MDATDPIVLRFYRLFKGLDRAHGQYIIKTTVAEGEKLQGSATTEKPGATPALWARHLTDAHYGLGIVPVNDEGKSWFGAIDIDVYPLDLEALAKEVDKLRLPLCVCRTKSGGAHLYLFARDPLPAELVRSKLMEWAVHLGYSGVEIFPKQIRLASENDTGNWINMPYQGGERSLRYCVNSDRGMTLAEFLDFAEGRSITEEQLKAVVLVPDENIDDILHQGPPCLQTLSRRGFPEGSRNNALFDLGVYLKKRYPDDWQERVYQINNKFMHPPKATEEATTIIKSLRKKAYAYRCKELPIAGCCNKQICLTRKYGIGVDGDDPGVTFGEMIKIETVPPTWIWDVNGARIELTTEQLMDQRLFRQRVLEELTILIHLVNAQAWSTILREHTAKAQIIVVPYDITPEGQWLNYVEAFCTGRAQGKSLDELLLGKAFTEEGRTFFRVPDIINYFQVHRVSGINEKRLFNFLREHKAEAHFKQMKGRGVNYWSIPAFKVQTEPFVVPRLDAEGEM